MAQQACSANAACQAITNNHCDPKNGFRTCRNPNLVSSSSGSCSWLKGMKNDILFILLVSNNRRYYDSFCKKKTVFFNTFNHNILDPITNQPQEKPHTRKPNQKTTTDSASETSQCPLHLVLLPALLVAKLAMFK